MAGRNVFNCLDYDRSGVSLPGAAQHWAHEQCLPHRKQLQLGWWAHKESADHALLRHLWTKERKPPCKRVFMLSHTIYRYWTFIPKSKVLIQENNNQRKLSLSNFALLFHATLPLSITSHPHALTLPLKPAGENLHSTIKVKENHNPYQSAMYADIR